MPRACCGYLTFTERSDTCPVCNQKHDLVQEERLYDDDGANKVSLVKARENFRKFGACMDMEF
ncbi:hypothetical protein DCC81_00485 [Chitinophaga parva]|uniref:Cysteine-rich CPCC domain-containing protein n=2 Tax=Chitinophaga parva TaxID=2169414 RepID=A0A2T7BQ57_9BACT|nr:hypothetical protein DCC81_00485 [Chitinophaga parva]